MKTKGSNLRCPFCTRQAVRIKRGRLTSHLSPGGVKCFAVGFRLVVSAFYPEGDPNKESRYRK